MLHTTEVMAIFVIFWPILAKIWLPWQRPLNPCNHKSLIGIGRSRKTHVIRNHIPVVSPRNAFIAILVPKLVAMVTPLCPLCTGVSHQFPDSTNPMSKPNSVWLSRIQLKLWPFCDILAYFGQKLVAMAMSIRPLQSEMTSLDCSTTKTPL